MHKWTVDGRQELGATIIDKAFKKCYISNKLDNNEDEVLYEEFIQKQGVNRGIIRNQ